MSTPAARANIAARPNRSSFEAGSPQSDAVLVSLYRLDNGSAADDQAVVNGTVVGTWTATDTGSLAVGVGGTSMYKDGGTAHITLPASNSAHDLTQLSLSFYYQPQFGNNKHILFACASTGASVAGDLSIERLTNGRLRAWHVGQDGGLRFFESTDGIAATNLVTGTAYRITATFGLGGAKLYLDNTLVASISQNTNGWNNARVKYLGTWVDGTSDPAQGLFDHVRIWDGELQASGVAALEAAQSASSGEYITTPEEHGWGDAPNTATSNTVAFNAAIDDARTNAGSSSTGRGVVELVQGKTYVVKTSGNGTQNNQTACLTTSLSNVEIRTIGKPSRSSGNQAIIQIESWAGKTGQHNQCIIRLENDSNTFLGWVTFHGNKQSLDNVTTSINYNVGQNSGIHNIVAYGGVTNFTMKEVSTEHAIADALLVDQGTTLSTGHLYEDCTFKRSRRQGLSFIKGGSSSGGIDQFVFRRCDFIDNGDFPGDVPGQQPGYGFDVEADETDDHVYGFSVYDSLVNNNKGSRYHHGVIISSQYGVGFVFHHKAICSDIRLIDITSSNNFNYNVEIGQRDAPPTWTNWRIENLVSTGAGTSNKVWFGGTASTNGGSITNLVITNTNTPLFEWEAGAFAAPHNTGWGCTIWKGDFNPTVTKNGVSTITVNNGFPP